MEVITKAMREALGLNEDPKGIVPKRDFLIDEGHIGEKMAVDMSDEEVTDMYNKVTSSGEDSPVKKWNKKKNKIPSQNKAGGGKVYRGRSYASGGRVAKYKG
tara:strand:+ start:208 stop:513 length:306 start_codon:yes stop_codon:yes gene_type:complete